MFDDFDGDQLLIVDKPVECASSISIRRQRHPWERFDTCCQTDLTECALAQCPDFLVDTGLLCTDRPDGIDILRRGQRGGVTDNGFIVTVSTATAARRAGRTNGRQCDTSVDSEILFAMKSIGLRIYARRRGDPKPSIPLHCNRTGRNRDPAGWWCIVTQTAIPRMRML